MPTTEIAFDCPHCQAPFVVDGSAAGMETSCPECGKMITIPLESEVDYMGDATAEAPAEQQATPPSSGYEAPRKSSTLPTRTFSLDEADTLPPDANSSFIPDAEKLEQPSRRTSRSFADKSLDASAAKKSAQEQPSKTASSLPRKNASGIPLQRNRGHRDLSSVAKGQTAGRVEQIRGGWRGYCPECGDVFLFSKGDAQRGAELQCTRCFCDIRIHEGDPPRLETLRVESPKKRAQRLEVLPSGTQGRNVQATMEHDQMNERQFRQAKDRAMQVSSGKDKWLWLRILALLLLIVIAFFLIKTLRDRAQGEGETEERQAPQSSYRLPEALDRLSFSSVA